ncbi:hypothetical protein DFQ28_000709 [Apophysomyces sp. BC1034]|nr:hypothetical protein DFQ29_010125 [Apophysomyces sp. BC1021]KAG0191216.1 hypothetical protein DFQ28_000709 [Apophysomyces sp. BC1034]
MDEAKFVRMKSGKRNLEQVKDYVVDKGAWRSLGKGRAQMKAGLFIVNMVPTSNTQKETATPLRKPVPTAVDLGFEICSSNVSDYLSVSTDEDENQEECEKISYIQVGNGSSRYSFLFRIMEARYLDALLREATGARAYFQYTLFRNQEIRCLAFNKQTTWHVLEQPQCLLIQGDLHDILQWLDRQSAITVRLLVLQDGSEQTVGSARVRIGRWQRGVEKCSFPVYDRCHKMSLWQHNIAQVTVQMGLMESWRPAQNLKCTSTMASGTHLFYSA